MTEPDCGCTQDTALITPAKLIGLFLASCDRTDMWVHAGRSTDTHKGSEDDLGWCRVGSAAAAS